jgi:hypothetical protein
VSEEIEPLVDVAGNTINIGDPVVYPQMSGRSVQQVLGKLVAYNGKTAQIERVEGGRWKAGYQSTKHRDTRTGKNINVWSNSMAHWLRQPSLTYVHEDPSKPALTEREFFARFPWSRSSQPSDERFKYTRTYDRGQLHDYMEEFTEPLKPVTIRCLDNIVKVVPADGES